MNLNFRIGMVFLLLSASVVCFAEVKLSEFQSRINQFQFHFNVINQRTNDPEEISMDLVASHHSRVVDFWSSRPIKLERTASSAWQFQNSDGFFDLISFKEVNLEAAEIWQDLEKCYFGNLEEMRREYFIGLPSCSEFVPRLQNLNEKLYSVLISSSITSLDLNRIYKQVENPNGEFVIHPLIVQVISQYMAAIKGLQSLRLPYSEKDLYLEMQSDFERVIETRALVEAKMDRYKEVFQEFLMVSSGFGGFFKTGKLVEEMKSLQKWLEANDPDYNARLGNEAYIKEYQARRNSSFRLISAGDPNGKFYETLKMLLGLAINSKAATSIPRCHALGLAPLQNLLVFLYWDGTHPLDHRGNESINYSHNVIQSSCGFGYAIGKEAGRNELSLRSLRENIHFSHIRQVAKLHRMYSKKLVTRS